MKIFFLHRAFCALSLSLLASCSKTTCRQWECYDERVGDSCFNSARLLLAPSSDYCHLEFEIDRTRTGLRLYVNILLLQAYPLPDDPTRTSMDIIFDDESVQTVRPYILTGGQRLLLPTETAEELLEKLLSDESFTIRIGRQELKVVVENFPMAYGRLMDMSISNE